MKRLFVLVAAISLSAGLMTSSEARPPRAVPSFRPPVINVPSVPSVSAPQNVPAYALVQSRLLARLAKEKKSSRNPKMKRMMMTARSFDWTALGIGTRVRNQGQSGTCWAHAGVETLEASVEILTDKFPLLAVQPVLDQTRDNQGGAAQKVLTELKRTGTGTVAEFPWLNGRLGPPIDKKLPYRSAAWSLLPGTNIRPATIAQLKMALVQYGPLYTTLWASTPGFMLNTGQVLAEPGPFPSVDHAVLLVGWNDTLKAWKIKNSWGTAWGAKGYGWVAYGHYNLGISTAWVRAEAPLGDSGGSAQR
jgi:hypothetical protein